MQVQTVFVSAEAKPAGNGYVYRLEQQSGGWVSTFDTELATKAQSLLNQLVTADIVDEPAKKINPTTGQPYINKTLKAIYAGAPDQTQQLGQITFAPTTGTATTSFTGGLSGTYIPTGSGLAPSAAPVIQGVTAKDRSIWAQSASKVAASLMQFFSEKENTLNTFDRLVEREYRKYERALHGTWPEAAVPAAPAPDERPAYTDEDIPF